MERLARWVCEQCRVCARTWGRGSRRRRWARGMSQVACGRGSRMASAPATPCGAHSRRRRCPQRVQRRRLRRRLTRERSLCSRECATRLRQRPSLRTTSQARRPECASLVDGSRSLPRAHRPTGKREAVAAGCLPVVARYCCVSQTIGRRECERGS